MLADDETEMKAARAEQQRSWRNVEEQGGGQTQTGICRGPPARNINSSHLSAPVPTMNNEGSTQRCQSSELLIHNHRLALARSVGALSAVGRKHRLNHMHVPAYRKRKCTVKCADV